MIKATLQGTVARRPERYQQFDYYHYSSLKDVITFEVKSYDSKRKDKTFVRVELNAFPGEVHPLESIELDEPVFLSGEIITDSDGDMVFKVKDHT